MLTFYNSSVNVLLKKPFNIFRDDNVPEVITVFHTKIH